LAHLADAKHPVPDAYGPAGEITGHLFERHVFVCTGGDYCAVTDGDGRGVHSRLKSLVAQEGLKGRVRVNHAGCLDQCGYGPMVVVYPDNVYSGSGYTASEQHIPRMPVLRGRALPAVTLPAAR
jgi:hypothetical protein